jgi:uncharacterized protein
MIDETSVSGFEWDSGNLGKCQQHGLSIAEIEALFRNPHHLIPDVAHSTVETRFLAIGKGDGPRLIFAAFVLRSTDQGSLIRPISARYMHQKEVDHYEQVIAKIEE